MKGEGRRQKEAKKTGKNVKMRIITRVRAKKTRVNDPIGSFAPGEDDLMAA